MRPGNLVGFGDMRGGANTRVVVVLVLLILAGGSALWLGTTTWTGKHMTKRTTAQITRIDGGDLVLSNGWQVRRPSNEPRLAVGDCVEVETSQVAFGAVTRVDCPDS